VTLMKVTSQHVMRAEDGALQAEDLGRCATRTDAGGLMIRLRCQKFGRTPFCLGATLYGSAEHNPEVLQCDPDYRPYLPSPTSPLSAFAVDIPIRDPTGLAHYPLEAAPVAGLQLLIRVYAVKEHVIRTLLTPRMRLIDARAGSM
jgi:hypothetical protein